MTRMTQAASFGTLFLMLSMTLMSRIGGGTEEPTRTRTRRRRMRSLQWVWIAGLLCLGACSQKDPGDGGGDSGSGGSSGRSGSGAAGSTAGRGGGNPSVADDYYPMVDGSTITYRHTGGTTWDDRTTVRRMDWMGESAFVTEGAADPKGETSKNIITRDGTRWLRAHKEEFRGGTLQGTVEYVPGFIRFDSAWTDVADGYSEQVTYTRIEKTAMGSEIANDDREHTFTVEEKNDTVTVPAGTFDDCMRVRRTRVRGNPANASDDDDKVFWFCKGIGKVKEQSDIGGGNEELVSCNIPGGSCP